MLKKTLALTISLCFQLSWAGTGFSEEGDALSAQLRAHLVSVGICPNTAACANVADIYRRDGKTIEMNLYAANDPAVVHAIFGFVAANGLRITNGKPITLSAFPEPKESYVNSLKGFRASRNPPVTLLLRAR